MREDMRDVQVSGPIELKNVGGILMALFGCVIAFLTFSRSWLLLFKFPMAAGKPSRATAQ